ncbi:hypothetical protein PSPO01_10725 [Paraphaeosphaeria sporulosa]
MGCRAASRDPGPMAGELQRLRRADTARVCLRLLQANAVNGEGVVCAKGGKLQTAEARVDALHGAVNDVMQRKERLLQLSWSGCSGGKSA